MPSPTEELRAAAETRRELGPHYDEAVLLSLAERLERKRGRSHALHELSTVTIALASLGFGVLVATSTGTVATIVAWLCIVAINVVHARAR
jgi:hypothetical protein